MRVPDHVITNLLHGACPERRAELNDFYCRNRPTFDLLQDRRGTTMNALRNRVSWTHKTVVHDWLLAFSGWKVFVAYSPLILTAKITTGELSQGLFAADDGLHEAEQAFDEVNYCARLARDAESFDDVPWPASITQVTDDRESIPSTEGKAAFDLACISVAATFLHELRHVQFWNDQNAPSDPQEEERACDSFSRTFLLDRVADYSISTGTNAELVASKRIMGLATAAYTIGEATPKGLAASISDTHPPPPERFRALVLDATAPGDADCWTYTASLLLASIRRSHRFPSNLRFSSSRDLSEKLVDLL